MLYYYIRIMQMFLDISNAIFVALKVLKPDNIKE